MWEQAAALLDWGFALPADTPSVGLLVDAAPAVPPPTTEPAEAPEAAARDGSVSAAASALPIGLALVAATIVLAAVLRQRTRR
jgi:D-alanyl-D-alanine carboxypeptidase (penicillin-binding protein 5/6)